jgi:hypothetical protein
MRIWWARPGAAWRARRRRCQHCGKGAEEIQGWLHPAQVVGGAGLWECRPACAAPVTPDEPLCRAKRSNA